MQSPNRSLHKGTRLMHKEALTKQRKFPPGWDEERVRRVIEHYESQSEDEAVAEDEAALDSSLATVMNVPKKLVPEIRELIARRKKVS